jgi:hypothetical protein
MTAGHAVTVETTKGKGRVRPRQKVMEAARRMGTTVPPVIPRLTGACLPNAWPPPPVHGPDAGWAARVACMVVWTSAPDVQGTSDAPGGIALQPCHTRMQRWADASETPSLATPRSSQTVTPIRYDTCTMPRWNWRWLTDTVQPVHRAPQPRRRVFESRRTPPPHSSHANPIHTDPQVPLQRPRGDEQGGQSHPPGARITKNGF